MEGTRPPAQRPNSAIGSLDTKLEMGNTFDYNPSVKKSESVNKKTLEISKISVFHHQKWNSENFNSILLWKKLPLFWEKAFWEAPLPKINHTHQQPNYLKKTLGGEVLSRPKLTQGKNEMPVTVNGCWKVLFWGGSGFFFKKKQYIYPW